jgi:hypothetical protein
VFPVTPAIKKSARNADRESEGSSDTGALTHRLWLRLAAISISHYKGFFKNVVFAVSKDETESKRSYGSTSDRRPEDILVQSVLTRYK